MVEICEHCKGKITTFKICACTVEEIKDFVKAEAGGKEEESRKGKPTEEREGNRPPDGNL